MEPILIAIIWNRSDFVVNSHLDKTRYNKRQSSNDLTGRHSSQSSHSDATFFNEWINDLKIISRSLWSEDSDESPTAMVYFLPLRTEARKAKS